MRPRSWKGWLAVGAVLAVAAVLAFVVPIALRTARISAGEPRSRSTDTNVSANGVFLTTRLESLKDKLVPASAAGQGVIGVGRNGCVTVGSLFLVAPRGSTISGDGKTLHLAGIGPFNVGQRLPALGGVPSEPLKLKDLPSNYAHCGVGSYENVWGSPAL